MGPAGSGIIMKPFSSRECMFAEFACSRSGNVQRNCNNRADFFVTSGVLNKFGGYLITTNITCQDNTIGEAYYGTQTRIYDQSVVNSRK